MVCEKLGGVHLVEAIWVLTQHRGTGQGQATDDGLLGLGTHSRGCRSRSYTLRNA